MFGVSEEAVGEQVYWLTRGVSPHFDGSEDWTATGLPSTGVSDDQGTPSTRWELPWARAKDDGVVGVQFPTAVDFALEQLYSVMRLNTPTLPSPNRTDDRR
jgi:hypothetical protein